jgi:hypothetical protein|tara:strand:- start:10 stop:135 length:126 start_codon:yes stop_codon:yes gene_type:complete
LVLIEIGIKLDEEKKEISSKELQEQEKIIQLAEEKKRLNFY